MGLLRSSQLISKDAKIFQEMSPKLRHGLLSSVIQRNSSQLLLRTLLLISAKLLEMSLKFPLIGKENHTKMLERMLQISLSKPSDQLDNISNLFTDQKSNKLTFSNTF